jgi:hypothetical protein
MVHIIVTVLTVSADTVEVAEFVEVGNERVFATLEKAGLVELIGRENVRNHINGALSRAEEIIKA